jgi:Uma2 family endonuclease
LFSHGRLKTEFVSGLSNLVKRSESMIVSDSTRIASERADLSAEPDIVLLSRDSIRSSQVRLTPKANRDGDYIEIDGALDLVIEEVSDCSVVKDTRRLPTAYFRAGVKEYWIADARSDDLIFAIHLRGDSSFIRAPLTKDGWQPSVVLGKEFLLARPVVEPDWV